ncbi:MAG: hypothetical protein ACRDWN_10680, partial [Acidimicrobiales bacterium]
MPEAVITGAGSESRPTVVLIVVALVTASRRHGATASRRHGATASRHGATASRVPSPPVQLLE